jgi:hypothetical protein
MKKIVACALVMSACGTWSNEDLEFLYALPDKATLHSVAPGEMASSSQGLTRQGLNVGDDSQVAQATKKMSDQFNAFLDSVLNGLEGIRQIPPTTRTADARVWGPYPDSQHNGTEVQVVVERIDGGVEYDWALEYTRTGQNPFIAGGGSFQPTVTLTQGVGQFGIDLIGARDYFDAGDSGDPDLLGVKYDTKDSPKLVQMFFTKGLDDAGTGVLGYQYLQNDAGEVHADFLAVGGSDPNITGLLYDVKWDKSGEGLASVAIVAGNWADAGIPPFEECWDTAQKVVYSTMIFDGGPSPVGLQDACVKITDL